ncbi:conjugal transfer protein TraD [Erwinia amylovora]|uniref:conjugal transfer protein TraD n=1 Tax=Erwinia amylovora TaxID=552 RepID=UPI001444353A|nr:conjugal transfer protein TraD [Erwinia amylovora]
MTEDKKLKQLLASAQQELNRLTKKEKELSRKQKTQKKIVLGGEVAKYLGLDVNQDMLVGFLINCAGLTEEQRKRFISNGARARENENMRNEQKNKISAVKRKQEKQQAEVADPELKNGNSSEENKEDKNGLNLRYQNRFSSILGKVVRVCRHSLYVLYIVRLLYTLS